MISFNWTCRLSAVLEDMISFVGATVAGVSVIAFCALIIYFSLIRLTSHCHFLTRFVTAFLLVCFDLMVINWGCALFYVRSIFYYLRYYWVA